MKRVLLLGLLIIGVAVTSSLATAFSIRRNSQDNLLTPLLESTQPKPLQAYSIPNLATREYRPSHITVEKVLTSTDTYTSYLFSYTTLDKRMTGLLNVPTEPLPGNPTVIMLRGYVPPESFETGVGTRNAGYALAQNGFITLAPDFFSYGGSDPEPEDVWQARFEKPIVVIELLKTLQAEPLTIDPATLDHATPVPTTVPSTPQTLTVGKIGLWGHSNGGQIALSTLEVLGTRLPTTLWAPVTAPFPYSILYFSDESADEGKESRKWIGQFEDIYDVFDFSLTQHLDRLYGPLQIHHGTHDDAALKAWSDEFIAKVETENERRAKVKGANTQDTSINQSELEPIEIKYFVYEGADHNLQPSWQTVVDRDIEFFTQQLSN